MSRPGLMTGDFSGWVYKQGSLVKSWKKRFMVLRGKQLTYFDTAQITPKVKEKGSFKVITVELSSDLQNGLIIHGVNGRVLKLYTDSSESTSQWYNAIMEACNNKPNSNGGGGSSRRNTMISNRATVCSNPERFSGNNSTVHVDSEIDLMDRLDIQADVIDESQVKYSGWLLKEGSRVKSWKRRYFSLRGNVVSYFNSADTGNSAKGYGTVYGVQVNMTKLNSLDIQFDNGRVLRVTADTQEEMETWLAYLTMAANIGKVEKGMLHPTLLQNPRVSMVQNNQVPQWSSMPSVYQHGGSNQYLSLSASSFNIGPSATAPNRHSTSSLPSTNDINDIYANKYRYQNQYSSASSSNHSSYGTVGGGGFGPAGVPEADIYDSEDDDSDGDWI